ncbi:MAG: BMC domain-containing protein [Calditrichaeota bacterium]|nr:BMC domain-containing protein [Calditrichota bacterium]
MKKYPAIALIEFSSIANGILSGDAMVKKAPITMLKSGTVSRGNYLILIGGSVASVEEAFAEGLTTGDKFVVDKVILPDVHPQVHDAILGNKNSCEKDAIGVIETTTVATTIRAADAGIKGASVSILEMRLADGMGGKSFTIFSGAVEDVESALEIARNSVEKPEFWLNSTLIPRLDPEMVRQIEATTRFSVGRPQILENGEI